MHPDPDRLGLGQNLSATYFNRASSLNGIRELAEIAGASVSDALGANGIPIALLDRPDDRIPFERTCALFEYCAKAWDMPDFGLRMSTYHRLEMLGPIALVTKMESDLRGALTSITRNLVLHSNAIFATLKEEGDVATLSIEAAPTSVNTKQFEMMTVAVARTVVEQAGEKPIDLIEATFRFRAGQIEHSAARFLGCPVRFGSEANAISFDRSELSRKIHQGDAAYRLLIERYLNTAHNEVPATTSDDVRREVARQMEFGDCTLESVARSLNQEPRSLQRRLQQENTSFREIIDDWRRERALSLIANTRLPLSEISLVLGYSNQSIFSRAFQRWYGTAPQVYRASLLKQTA